MELTDETDHLVLFKHVPNAVQHGVSRDEVVRTDAVN